MTLKEHNTKYPATPSRGKFHNIRINARKVMKDNNITYKCQICGYSNFLEVCHIKAIADFDDNATIENDINSLSNLAYLCPNHHKEIDRGLLPITAVHGSI
jgi:predicted restriction endonuclease